MSTAEKMVWVVLFGIAVLISVLLLPNAPPPPLKCYLNTLEVTETVEHGKVYVGTCDNGVRVELAEHD